MENSPSVNLKERLKTLLNYQDVLTRNYLLAQRTSDQGLQIDFEKKSFVFITKNKSVFIEFSAFLTFDADLRRKYHDLRAYADQQDRCIDEYRIESARKDKKIQSQSSQILRLTQHNKRNAERLAELQRCLDRIKGTLTEQNTYDQLRDILR